MKDKRNQVIRNSNGFSLIELMVVLVIAGIIATGVVFMFANPNAKVKTQAFEMLGEINYARAVSVKENQNVLVEFTPGTADGFQICFDLDPAGGNGDCGDAGDDILKNVVLRQDVQFYEFGATLPADGPAVTPPYATQAAGKALNNEDGIILTGNALLMQPDGTCNQDGAVVIYLPSESDPLDIRGVPYALVIGSASTGQVKLSRWRNELVNDGLTAHDDRWSLK